MKKDFKYDIAISLCKQDIGFARDLIKAINPSLNVFFYEDNQEELIGKMGPEAFAKVFKDEARVVIILYRKEWGESVYTEIEKNAIVDRATSQTGGYNFIFLIPLEKGESPSWYPSNRIYANPFRFNVEELARFCEFKVTEENGEIKPLTFEEKSNHFLEKLQKQQEINKYLCYPDSLDICKEELLNFAGEFNNKLQFVQQTNFPVQRGGVKFMEVMLFDRSHEAKIQLGDFHLFVYLQNSEDTFRQRIVSSQSFELQFSLIQTAESQGRAGQNLIEQKHYRYNQNGGLHKGWSEVIKHNPMQERELTPYLIKDFVGEYYHLGLIIGTNELIESWLEKILSAFESTYDQIFDTNE